MTAPLIKLDGPTQSRSVMFPDWLWESLEEAAEAVSRQTGHAASIADIVRQGAFQRAQAILGTDHDKLNRT